MKSAVTWLFSIDTAHHDELRRARTLVTLACAMIVVVLLALPLVMSLPAPLLGLAACLSGLLIYAIVLLLARRGYITAGGLLLVWVALGITLGVLASPGQSLDVLYFLAIPLLAGGLVLRPAHLWLILATTLAMIFGILSQLPGRPLASSASQLTIFSSALLLVIVALLKFSRGACHRPGA
jgi:rsbT co-antagonist protein RsbR